ncbi:MAG: hypothetical protein K5662_03530 [Lachnospiraceae bacterium]|nr:hypothetical protein [Lachnospiraceae bacterium]
MTTEDRMLLKRINDYAEKVMPDLVTNKIIIAQQITKLRPILQEIAMEKGMPVEDVLVKYMDLQSADAVEKEKTSIK